ncbi:hypothetical protein [Sodalis sp.]|uniref:hypothetical protein n=1 Tax=Sodalis sp. (in: enterobacteria) TaxID=1898979 RepID=UPI003873B2A7
MAIIILPPSITSALMPSAAIDSTEGTIAVKGTADADAAAYRQNQDYSVPTTTSSTKIPMM